MLSFLPRLQARLTIYGSGRAGGDSLVAHRGGVGPGAEPWRGVPGRPTREHSAPRGASPSSPASRSAGMRQADHIHAPSGARPGTGRWWWLLVFVLVAGRIAAVPITLDQRAAQ